LKNNVKKLRDAFDYTQDQLAELLGVSRQTIISIEKEKYDPSLELAFKFSLVFQQAIEDIFMYDVNKKQ
jgi:putative transcriptional regulator